jgi:TolB-like protein/DNA-binding winged helix-turn-helix (wHTH) protein
MSARPSSKAPLYRFADYELDPVTGELRNGAAKVQLQDQPLQLLLVLLEHPGELVTREQLVARLWRPQTFVDYERSLNKAVNKVREALGDSPDHPRFIETLPRKGYRFIAPVVLGLHPAETLQIAAPSPRMSHRRPSRWLIPVLGAAVCAAVVIAANRGGARNWLTNLGRPVLPHVATLAVLPLENLSRDAEQEYFADGTTDALITNLAKISSARITSRTSVMRYKGTKKTVREIGRELNADAIVEGTVQHFGNRVRITAQLIQVATDMHLWADAYEGDANQILELQARVATDIARKINVVVRPLESARAVNPQAYGLYLKGRYYFYQYTNRGWQQSINYFRQAIEADPGFAEAYSGLADCYLVGGGYGVFTPKDALAQGKAAALKALALNDHEAHAHYALANAYTWYDLDWAKADAEFQRAIALNPNDSLGRHWHGGYLSLVGRHEEALDEHERARQIDPYSLIINANLARALYWARRYDDAIDQAKRTLEMDPKFGVAALWLEASLRHTGRFKEAVALRQMFDPANAQATERTFKTQGFDPLLVASGEEFQKAGALVTAARCYAQVGRKEQALSLLESCAERRCFSLATLKVEPDFDGLRDEPRFRTLVQRVGLTAD